MGVVKAVPKWYNHWTYVLGVSLKWLYGKRFLNHIMFRYMRVRQVRNYNHDTFKQKKYYILFV